MAIQGIPLKPFNVDMLDKTANVYVLITPTQAAELMTLNTRNRRIKPLKIAQYAKDMANGNWHPQASSLAFSNEKVMLDGQNRLLACIQADVPFGTLLRTGLDPEAQTHMDSGAVRTMGDVFKMHGVSDFNNVAAACSLRTRYESIVEAGQTILEKRLPLTRQEALDYLAKHPQIEKFTTMSNSIYQVAPGIQRSVWIAGLSSAAESNEDLTRKVAAAFIAGDVSSYPPLVALMRYAMSTQTPKQQERAVKLKNAGLRHLTAVALTWGAIRDGAKLDKIVIRDDEKPVAFQ